MSIVHSLATESIIIAAAKRCWGVADAGVTRYSEKHGYNGRRDGQAEPDAIAGTWFCLTVRRTADSEWQTVCRRRTRAELLQLIESRGEPFPQLNKPLVI